MLLGFIILAVLAAVCFLPLLRKPNAGSSSAWDSAARALYRQRLEELEREKLDTDLLDELKDDAGRALLEQMDQADKTDQTDQTDTAAEETTPAQHVDSPRLRHVGLILMVLVPLSAYGLYYWLADPQLARIQGAEEILSLPPEDRARAQFWQERLQARVARAPDDAKSLYLLGHAELKLADYAAAAAAFARTHQLNPDDLGVQVYWLQSRFLASRGVVDNVSRQLAEDILKQAPNMPVVLEMLAMDAVQKAQPDQAVRLLNRALSSARDVSQQTNFVAAINELRKRFEQPGVTVNVSASEPPPHHATLFVIARPVGGGMPLAVVKLPAVLLPQTVRLDDLVSMSEAVKVTDAEQFEVVVRVSETGTPMPQPGDWQWVSEPLSVPAEPLSVTLSPPA